MIAMIERPDRFCVTRVILQTSLINVSAITYCSEETKAGDGVAQMPDVALTKPMPGLRDGRPRPPCPRCLAALKALGG